MKVDQKKLDLILAKQGKSLTDLRESFSPGTLTRMRNNGVRTKTINRLAKALGVEVEDLIEE